MLSSTVLTLALAMVSRASPLALLRPSRSLFSFGNDLATTAVNTTVVNADLVRPAQFSRLAYCSSPAVEALNCGAPCDDLGVGSVSVLLTGGWGEDIPLFYVAQDNKTQSIVVAHEGTNSSSLESILNDVAFGLVAANQTLFPGVGSDVKVHDGFQQTQGKTADTILATVKSSLSSTGFNKVLVTGHSLGAAIATLDALMFKMNLDPSVEVTTTLFGLPRGGNQAFADLVDAQFGSTYTFVTHGNDPVPLLPPLSLDFVHSSGEIHINSDGNIVACPGQENENCIDANTVLDVSIDDHLGPYVNGISMGGKACPA